MSTEQILNTEVAEGKNKSGLILHEDRILLR